MYKFLIAAVAAMSATNAAALDKFGELTDHNVCSAAVSLSLSALDFASDGWSFLTVIEHAQPVYDDSLSRTAQAGVIAVSYQLANKLKSDPFAASIDIDGLRQMIFDACMDNLTTYYPAS